MIIAARAYKGSLHAYTCIRALWQTLSDYGKIVMNIVAIYCCKAKVLRQGYENMNAVCARKYWAQSGESITPIMLLDVRTTEEYAKAHIADATLIPIRELESRLHEVPRNRCIYVYCHSGLRSANASALLSGAGYSNVVNMLGGIKAWQYAGYPVIK